MIPSTSLGWLGIVRLGLVQTALGSIVVLTTSTLNRVMVVEFALPAILPGALVALHHVLQLLRPRLGHGSDVGGRRTPWIIGGMFVLSLGGACAGVATAWMQTAFVAGVSLAVLAFAMIGLGVGACGTSLLVLLAKRVDPERRAAAATIVWVMMIFGFIVTATVAGRLLDPFSTERLMLVMFGVSTAAMLLTLIAVRGVEGAETSSMICDRSRAGTPFRQALAQVWRDPDARRFTVFVFVSMLAYSAQDLILEPFAGSVFGFTPGESTQLAGTQNGGVLSGMVLVALAVGGITRRRFGTLKAWTILGCVASAISLFALSMCGFVSVPLPLSALVFLLGVSNGVFAVAAIGSMMALAGAGGDGREGVRMGLWGASQAIAFGLGGFLGAAASDVARQILGTPLAAYSSVFAVEALLFLVAAVLAVRQRIPDVTEGGGSTTQGADCDVRSGYGPRLERG